jgi:hypothetical protein
MTTDEDVGRALGELARAEVSRRAPTHLEAAVVEGFNRQRRRRASFAYARKAVALPVLAAVVGTVIYLNMLVMRAPLPERPTEGLASHRAEFRPMPPPLDIEEPRLVLPAAVPPRAVQRPARDDREAVLTDVDRPAPGVDEAAQLVRIQLPRAMLPQLGVPVIDPDVAGTVNVELLLDNDGLARTIRIVP